MVNKVLITRPNIVNKSDGVATYCQELYELMQGVEDIIILPIKNYPGSHKPFKRFTYDWNTFLKELSSTDFDILHINGSSSFSVHQAFKAAQILKKKIVYTGHFHPFATTKHPLGLRLFSDIFFKPFFGKCAAITTLNSEDTAYYEQYSNKVHQIPHWSKFYVSETYIDKIEKNPKMILFVGRADSFNKGFDHLFYLPEGQYEIHCVGRGELPRKRSDIFHHKEVSDEELIELYARASLVVVPSSYEAFSYVALEALSMKTPIVISNNVRIGDYLHDFPCCTLFNYHDYDAFVNSVASTIGKPVQRNEILKIFNRDIIREKYAQLYRSL